MLKLPLRNEHVHDSGSELGEVNDTQMGDGSDLKKFHLSFTPALRQALRVEARLCGITQTDLIREAVLSWIATRIDQRNHQPISDASRHGH